MPIYKLDDFMEYPKLAFQIGMIPTCLWNGAQKPPRLTFISVLILIWFIFGVVNLIYQNIGMLIYLYLSNIDDTKIYGNGNISAIAIISETGGIMGLTIVSGCKMSVLFLHRNKISALLEQLKQIFPNEGAQQNARGLYRVHYYAEKSRLLMKCTTIFFLSAFCFYNALPILQIGFQWIYVEGITSYQFQSNTWYPWHNSDRPISATSFLLTYICQFQSSLTGVAFIMAGEFLLCFFITQLQLHFDHLANMLTVLNPCNGDTASEQLKLVIRQHNQLLEYTIEINNIFDGSFLVNFITSSIAICLMGFSMVMISPMHALKYSVGLLSFLVFTLFICYVGNELTDAGNKIAPAALYSNWYNGGKQYRQMVIVLMKVANRSCVLRAYKYTTVSIHTFMMILKISYQLFTFIKAMG